MDKYDVVIVGGLMTTYGLKIRDSNLNIVIIDRGNMTTNQKCSAVNE